MSPRERKGKFRGVRRAVETALDWGVVVIAIDPSVSGVVLPERHMKGPVWVNISRRFKDPLYVDDAGIRQVLSFAGRDFPCVFPWESVTGVGSMTDPGEVRASPKPARKARHLSVVKDEKGS